MATSYRRKICEPLELKARLEEARAAGRGIVHCHGCFDIVHPGHLRYLQFARQLGDVLVVSLTADGQMSKGLDRPYIPAELRAENLAAIELVDWVVIDGNPTALELIKLLRPCVYVKGAEYAASTDARFVAEKAAVEQYGGRVVFHSGDVVLSSSHVIENMRRDDELERTRLRALCERHGITRGRALDHVDGWERLRVVVVGDALREERAECDGLASSQPSVPTLLENDRKTSWRAAPEVALQARALGAQVTLVAPTGQCRASRELRRDLEAAQVTARLIDTQQRLTGVTTYVAEGRTALRALRGRPGPADSATERLVGDAAVHAISDADLLIACDYGLGCLTPGLLRELTQALRARSEHAVALASPLDGRGDPRLFRGFDFLMADESQLRSAYFDFQSALPALVWGLLQATDIRRALIRLPGRGVLALDGALENADSPGGRGSPPGPLPDRLRGDFVPALSSGGARDVSGESIAAIAGLALAAGGSLALAAYLSCGVEHLEASHRDGHRLTRTALLAWLDQRAELRPRNPLLPDTCSFNDIAKLAPPLPTLETVRPIAQADQAVAL